MICRGCDDRPLADLRALPRMRSGKVPYMVRLGCNRLGQVVLVAPGKWRANGVEYETCREAVDALRSRR